MAQPEGNLALGVVPQPNLGTTAEKLTDGIFSTEFEFDKDTNGGTFYLYFPTAITFECFIIGKPKLIDKYEPFVLKYGDSPNASLNTACPGIHRHGVINCSGTATYVTVTWEDSDWLVISDFHIYARADVA